MLLTRNSLGLRTVSCPIAGRPVLGRITAAATCKAKALEIAVEKMAVQVVGWQRDGRFPELKWHCWSRGATDALRPRGSGSCQLVRSNLSREKMVVPAETFPAPR